jgi:hypothetical protein
MKAQLASANGVWDDDNCRCRHPSQWLATLPYPSGIFRLAARMGERSQSMLLRALIQEGRFEAPTPPLTVSEALHLEDVAARITQ